jgi:hypothetical protein
VDEEKVAFVMQDAELDQPILSIARLPATPKPLQRVPDGLFLFRWIPHSQIDLLARSRE